MSETDNPYAAPEHSASIPTDNPDQEWVYVGFWKRVLATIIDQIILGVIGAILGAFLALVITGKALPVIANLSGIIIGLIYMFGFWIARNATPGKMVFKAEIRDAQTFGKPSVGQFIGRYFASILSWLCLGIGIIWVAFDKRKQGWHDLMAGTVVVSPREGEVIPVARRERRTRPPLHPEELRREAPADPGT